MAEEKNNNNQQQPQRSVMSAMIMLTSSSTSSPMSTTQQTPSQSLPPPQLTSTSTPPQIPLHSFQTQERQSIPATAPPPLPSVGSHPMAAYMSYNHDQPPPLLPSPGSLPTVGSLLVKTPAVTAVTATASTTATATPSSSSGSAPSTRCLDTSSCSCGHSHGCSSGTECGCDKNGCDPCNMCRLELLSFPRDNVRDSFCYLQGCTPIHYRFKFKLHTSPDKKYLGSAYLSAILLAKVTKANGVEMERIIEDGLKGDTYIPFDRNSGECLIKISFQSAGRGAPWIIRFIASTSDPVTSESILKQSDSCGVTGVPGCKGCEMYSAVALSSLQGNISTDPVKQTVTMTELCHYDFPVKTYSKKAKITKILKGTDNAPVEKPIPTQKIIFHSQEFGAPVGGSGSGGSGRSDENSNLSSRLNIGGISIGGGNGGSGGSNTNGGINSGDRSSCLDGVMASSPTNSLRGCNGTDIMNPGSDSNGLMGGSDSSSLLDEQIHLDPEQIQLYQRQQRQRQQQQQQQQQQQSQQQSQQQQSSQRQHQQSSQQQQQIGGNEMGEEMEEMRSPPRKYLCQVQGPMLSGPGTQGDGSKVLWDNNFEATLSQIFETIVSQNGAYPLSRHLTKDDMQFIYNACMLPEYSGVQGAHMWISRAATGVAKIRRLWDIQSPLLIAGFISKDYTQRILAQCQPGTFMLRFSSGDPGELIIAFVLANEAGNTFVEQSYLVQDNEELSEAIVVERILENRLFLNGLDILSSTTFTKELFRPRSRYSKLNPIP